MSKIQQAGDEFPGVPLASFTATVDAIADLRDTGKVLIFLRGNGDVRIVGIPTVFAQLQESISKRLEGKRLEESDLRRAVAELEETVSANLGARNETGAAVRTAFRLTGDYAPNAKFDPANPVHDHMLKKVQAVAKLTTAALRERAARMRTVTVPFLEDLDAELVQARNDKLEDKRVDVPFLRLRLRYGEVRSDERIFYMPFFPNPSLAKSFELECDLSDLDLLQHRIDEARQMLLAVATPKEATDGAN